jgi:5'-nucleotidase
MRILITNDDGIHAPALLALHREFEPLGEITVVVPDRDQSATSHSLTLHRPLRIQEVGEDTYSVDGTPTDCVLVAFHGQLGERPDLVVSGINHGPNMGEDVFYSGTVAAAIEGVLQGVPGVAASLVTRQASDFGEPADVVGRILRQFLERGLTRRRLINLNIPYLPVEAIRGVRITRLGTRIYEDTLVRKVDPRGRDYYWIGGEDPVWRPDEGTDFHAVDAGYVSLTPLQLELTDPSARAELQSWGLTHR